MSFNWDGVRFYRWCVTVFLTWGQGLYLIPSQQSPVGPSTRAFKEGEERKRGKDKERERGKRRERGKEREKGGKERGRWKEEGERREEKGKGTG